MGGGGKKRGWKGWQKGVMPMGCKLGEQSPWHHHRQVINGPSKRVFRKDFPVSFRGGSGGSGSGGGGSGGMVGLDQSWQWQEEVEAW